MVPSIFHALVVPLLCIACLEQMFHRKNRPKVFGHFLWGAILKFLCRNIIRVVSIGAFYGRKYAQNAFANPNGGAYNIPPDPIAGGVAPSQEPHPYSRPLNPRGTLARHGDVRPPNFLEKPIISPSRTDAKSIISPGLIIDFASVPEFTINSTGNRLATGYPACCQCYGSLPAEEFIVPVFGGHICFLGTASACMVFNSAYTETGTDLTFVYECALRRLAFVVFFCLACTCAVFVL